MVSRKQLLSKFQKQASIFPFQRLIAKLIPALGITAALALAYLGEFPVGSVLSAKESEQDAPNKSMKEESQQGGEASKKSILSGDLDEAEKFLRSVVKDTEKQGEGRNLNLANCLKDLGLVLIVRGRPEEAESVLQRSMAIFTAVVSSDHPDIADILNLLSLVTKEKRLGPEHQDVATSLDSLATVYVREGKHIEAELFLKRSLEVREKALRPEHPDVALSINNLAELYRIEGKKAEAEFLLKHLSAIREGAKNEAKRSATLTSYQKRIYANPLGTAATDVRKSIDALFSPVESVALSIERGRISFQSGLSSPLIYEYKSREGITRTITCPLAYQENALLISEALATSVVLVHYYKGYPIAFDKIEVDNSKMLLGESTVQIESTEDTFLIPNSDSPVPIQIVFDRFSETQRITAWDRAIGVVWRFPTKGMRIKTKTYEYITEVPDAKIRFTKYGVVLENVRAGLRAKSKK